jgi:hypothetical protein
MHAHEHKEKEMTNQAISPKARAAGMDTRTLRRTLALIERYQRQAAILDKKAKVVTELIRKRRKHGHGAVLEPWLEDRDGLREDAQLLRIDAREMQRVLILVRRGRFVAAKAVLNGGLHSPLDSVSQILGPTVDRGLRKFHHGHCARTPVVL